MCQSPKGATMTTAVTTAMTATLRPVPGQQQEWQHCDRELLGGNAEPDQDPRNERVPRGSHQCRHPQGQEAEEQRLGKSLPDDV